MARLTALILILSLLPGWTDTRGMVRVERAPPGQRYAKYNPLVTEDRHRMALDLVKGECRRSRVVADEKIITEIWGLTSSLPDYVVLVRCIRKISSH